MQAIPSRFSWRRMSSSSSVSLSVREAVGSSRIRIFMCGRRRTRAISINCCLPMPRFFTLVVGSTESSFRRRIQSPVWEYISFQSRMPPRAISWPMKMFSAVESSGKRFSSWRMTAIPAASASVIAEKLFCRPATRISPVYDQKGKYPLNTLMNVDLPAPFSPHRAWIWFSSSKKETPSRARTPGKSLVMFRASRMAPISPPQTREGPRVRPLPDAACLSCSAWEASWPRERSCRRPRSDGSRRR